MNRVPRHTQYKSTIYEIYHDGRVWSGYKNEFLKLQTDKDGYNIASIYIDGIMYKVRVNRMVAETYIPNPSNLPQVNHKNGNKQDDDYMNLEWSTSSDNMRHACNTGLINRKQLSDNGKKSAEYAIINFGKPVEQLDTDGNVIARYRSVGEASKLTGAYKADIHRVCNNKQKSANKCRFRWEGLV